MPLLGPGDAPPPSPRRIVVAGTSGSGKTTLARQIGTQLDLPHFEIDSLFHGPGWTPNPDFVDEVTSVVESAAWVTEWQYPQARPMLVRRADLMVWLDYPRRVVMRQIVVRTISRRVRHEELWNANTEPPLSTFFTNPEHIIRWAWSTHPTTAQRVAEVVQSLPELPVVRLKSRSQARRWLDRLTP